MSLSEFQVVILAGGFGKHLNPLVEETPKQLLPVCNRPLLSYQLEMIENAGFTGTRTSRSTR
jgi:NDP-sugar pyrophosphorylase family protein